MSALSGFLVLIILLLAAVLVLVLPPLFRRGAEADAAEADHDNQVSSALAVLREQLIELDADHAAGNLDAAAYAEALDELERRALEEGEGSFCGSGKPRSDASRQAYLPAQSSAKLQAPGCAALTQATKPVPQPEKAWIFTLALGVPLLALVGYLLVGTPQALAPPLFGQEQLAASFAARAGALVTHLAAAPDDANGWEELAILRIELNDPAGAADALSHLSALRPNAADVLVTWAVAVAMRDQTLAGEAEALLRRALVVDPQHTQAQTMLRNWEQRHER
ncbi:hypothetical protein FACS1894116_14370 [Betaproteobacteria bacterium]|nr:hypothetical protein FACS1894116_14370 [Betaproteobacteria bacterium]GHU23528.1 hypothetical protein FACS189488_06300 [Betaproteobacteria bacterium]GHU32267.1 hypothetical protein FACS189497_13770 [Betaproteobacteria bacterium]